MNGIRKLAFHAARYNWVKYLGSDVRSRPLQSVRRAFFSYRTVVILHRERPCLGSRSGGVFKLSIAVLRRGFFPSPDGSELYLCMPKIFSAYERSSLCEAGRSPESNAFLTDIMNMTQNRQTEMPGNLKHQATSTLSGSMKSTSASRSYSASPDWSITGASLS